MGKKKKIKDERHTRGEKKKVREGKKKKIYRMREESEGETKGRQKKR